MDIASLLNRTVERSPDRLALIDGDRSWTYTQWRARVRRFAAALFGLGVRPLDRIAIYIYTSEETATTYITVRLIDAVVVPINFRSAAGEAAYVNPARTCSFAARRWPEISLKSRVVAARHSPMSHAMSTPPTSLKLIITLKQGRSRPTTAPSRSFRHNPTNSRRSSTPPERRGGLRA